MEEMKIHIRHVIFWKFKCNKNIAETDQKIWSVLGQSVIPGQKSETGIQSFSLGIHHWDMNLDQYAHQASI